MPELIVENSIWYDRVSSGAMAVIGDVTSGPPDVWTMTNNLWWNPDNATFTVCAIGDCDDITFAAWQALGKDANGQLAQAKFKNVNGRAYPINAIDFKLFCGSPGMGDGDDGLNVGALDTFCPGGGRTSHGKGKGK
jgi:hypothetical protein